jgi:hypothetical protein
LRRVLCATLGVGGLMLVAAACSYDFDQFQYAVGTDGGPAAAADGATETDGGTSAVDVVAPPADAATQ